MNWAREDVARLLACRASQAPFISSFSEQCPGQRWLTSLSPAGFYYYWGLEVLLLLACATPPELRHEQKLLPCQIREAFLSESLPKLELPTWICFAKALRPVPEEDEAFIMKDNRIIAVAGDLLRVKVQDLDDETLAILRGMPPLANGASRIPCRARDLAFPPAPQRSWAASLFISRPQPLAKSQRSHRDSVGMPIVVKGIRPAC
ncbi:hypothetical protein WJX74_004528 [Apatococcus lobatus]|uniref:Uncharacterized protein n=1 Tax=Apatococcus lobatus TaxID=904363 RepID=A0AAW1R1I6_9CHLO